MEKIKFVKYHGLGNDFVVFKDSDLGFSDEKYQDLTRKVCHRKLGIGADGVLIQKGNPIDGLEMMIINADGSIDTMCGNGVRCFAAFLLDEKIISKDEFKIITKGGIQLVKIYDNKEEETISEVNLGIPKYIKGDFEYEFTNTKTTNEKNINGTYINNGTPHIVYFLDKDWYYFGEDGKENLKKIIEIGGELSSDVKKFNEEVSVNFPIIINRKNINLITFERGVGLTSACGTGTAASVAAGIKLGLLDNSVKADLMYGSLQIKKKEDGSFLMKGPAKKVFDGLYNYE
ncbi:MAG: diaminopimelate epimerase [Clostridiales Family XIII bacterium]|jgi:diaminopimelate epimerase|nr:diaminopimelate epimerase [Clostridiales Family XIII bacterium]